MAISSFISSLLVSPFNTFFISDIVFLVPDFYLVLFTPDLFVPDLFVHYNHTFFKTLKHIYISCFKVLAC